MPVLPDKPITKSWVARGAAVYFGAKVLEALGVIHPGVVDGVVTTVQNVDPNAVIETAQGAAVAAIAVGFRRVGGQILGALQQVLAALKTPAI